jgi:hypothetical protein
MAEASRALEPPESGSLGAGEEAMGARSRL